VVHAAERAETSYFERMRRDHPRELRAGIAQLRRDIAAGAVAARAASATVLSWTKPAS
jgi:hypothetical protein